VVVIGETAPHLEVGVPLRENMVSLQGMDSMGMDQLQIEGGPLHRGEGMEVFWGAVVYVEDLPWEKTCISRSRP
jgi:hypothetical protein